MTPNKFPTTRRVLIEKQINSISKKQFQYFLEFELSDCVIYKEKDNRTFYYVKNEIVLLEAQSYSQGVLLNPSVVRGLCLNTFFPNLCQDIFHVYDTEKIKIFINMPSKYLYVQQRQKIE